MGKRKLHESTYNVLPVCLDWAADADVSLCYMPAPFLPQSLENFRNSRPTVLEKGFSRDSMYGSSGLEVVPIYIVVPGTLLAIACDITC